MANDPIELDGHRGMAAQQATELRRQRLLQFQAKRIILLRREEDMERLLLAAPSKNWPAAAAKAQHLIQLLATTPYGQSPRCKELISRTLDDLRRLSKQAEVLT